MFAKSVHGEQWVNLPRKPHLYKRLRGEQWIRRKSARVIYRQSRWRTGTSHRSCSNYEYISSWEIRPRLHGVGYHSRRRAVKLAHWRRRRHYIQCHSKTVSKSTHDLFACHRDTTWNCSTLLRQKPPTVDNLSVINVLNWTDFIEHTCSLEGLNCWINYTIIQWYRQLKMTKVAKTGNILC